MDAQTRRVSRRVSFSGTCINTDIERVKSDVGKYSAVNQHIGKLQADLLRLQNNVVDLGHRTLKVESIEATGRGGEPSYFSLARFGSPPIFNTVEPDGQIRPVASYSTIGFQDLSQLPKPLCDEKRRGTIYVQKGGPHQADTPFVCIKGNADGYRWLELATNN